MSFNNPTNSKYCPKILLNPFSVHQLTEETYFTEICNECDKDELIAIGQGNTGVVSSISVLVPQCIAGVTGTLYFDASTATGPSGNIFVINDNEVGFSGSLLQLSKEFHVCLVTVGETVPIDYTIYVNGSTGLFIEATTEPVYLQFCAKNDCQLRTIEIVSSLTQGSLEFGQFLYVPRETLFAPQCFKTNTSTKKSGQICPLKLVSLLPCPTPQ